MLVFTLNTKPVTNQFRIGDGVIVRLLKIQGNQASVGIEAPKTIKVDREKVYQARLALLAATAAKKQAKKPPRPKAKTSKKTASTRRRK